MKNFNVLLILISGCLVLNSCVKTEDFQLPESKYQEINIEGDITGISAVKSNFNPETEEIYVFSETNTLMEAYVVSSDEGGNFYKELVLQDKPENPTAGILLLVDDNSLFETYNFGRKIYVKLDGLALWSNNGVHQLGVRNRGDVVAIPPSRIDDHIIRTMEAAEIVPLQLEISEFNERHENLFIEVKNVQFNRNLLREQHHYTFAGEVTDEYDGERQLESCSTGASAMLSTSTFSGFKSLYLPQNSGSVKGVLSRNFYDDYFVIAVNSPDDFNFDGERCDPDFLNCGNNNDRGSIVIFEEDFTGITSQTALKEKGWTNLNVNGGKAFEPGTFDGNRYIRVSAFNTEEAPMEAWLVSPSIDLDSTSGALLSFEIMSSYDNATILSVLVTEEFTGNVLTTNWTPLDAVIPIGPTNQYGKRFEKSEIDISCLKGDIRFAFRYLGAAPDKSTTYDIDNIRVSGN
ncbi:DUF5689 domain-containing protein [Salegentibacter salegens]|uniref:DUF5689 domain-containing protein n=1 Tax=Salegentibacter salegens TaxID=143223 RepID=A0A1M7LZ56_9FLAO|nr:DUF5689 domain-containing protein [Salegentibacter salegens]PRX52083.1 hypothetical protein LY58_00247 [Salegentibacter salegens]SHM83562.1 hypothetical protein SAMN05878281_2182 [Salegentibacter salegens]